MAIILNTYRKFDTQDIAALKAMITDFAGDMGETLKDDVYSKMLNPNNQISLLRDKRDIVGFIVYKYQGSEVYISALGVANGQRRKGYGKHLMELFLNQMSLKHSIKTVKLGVMKSNHTAIVLYEDMGFQTVAEGVEEGIAFKSMQLNLTGEKVYRSWVV